MKKLTFILLLSATICAQGAAPTPDPLPEVDALKLENALKDVQIKTLELNAVQASAQALYASLQRKGFTLQRGADGKWSYTPEKTGK